LPVDASASITPGACTVTITLDNLEANPTSVIQLISGISFSIAGASGSGLLSTLNSGNTISIAQNGTYSSLGSDALSRWKANETGSSIKLTTLSGGNPDRLIIGPPNGSNKYSAANASIRGDNPNIFETASFTITVPGVSLDSIITDAIIYFGTDNSTLTNRVPDGGSTVTLLGLAILGIGSVRRYLKA